MGSLHSFDRALDKFMAWLSDAESSLESLEIELENYGPGVKTSRERVLMQLKVGIIRLTPYARDGASRSSASPSAPPKRETIEHDQAHLGSIIVSCCPYEQQRT